MYIYTLQYCCNAASSLVISNANDFLKPKEGFSKNTIDSSIGLSLSNVVVVLLLFWLFVLLLLSLELLLFELFEFAMA